MKIKFGRNNRKPSRCGADGLYPFVRVVEASGASYPAAERFLATVQRQLDEANRERAERAAAASYAPVPKSALKTIDDFRNNPAYCGDGKRVDLA